MLVVKRKGSLGEEDATAQQTDVGPAEEGQNAAGIGCMGQGSCEALRSS